MANKHIVGAALAAWFSLTSASAQADPTAPAATKAHLAAAVLAETRGDLDGAIRELEAALATATPDGKARVEADLAMLRQRIGQPVDPTSRTATEAATDFRSPELQDPSPQDPVRRLIATLDRGSDRDSSVHEAARQISDLGALAIPQLLDAMPELGPFGLRNALEILVRFDDGRVQQRLRDLLERQDTSIDASLAVLLNDMAPGNKRLVAERLVAPGQPPARRLAAFEVLAGADQDPARLTSIARELVQTPALHDELIRMVMKHGGPWTEVVIGELSARGSGYARAMATEMRLLRDDELTEDAALAAIMPLELPFRRRVATALAGAHRSWVNIGVIALDPSPRLTAWNGEWVRTMEWWRQPDQAVQGLLALPAEGLQSSYVRSAIEEIVRSGWRLPPSLESAFERYAQLNSWQTLVAVLPDDGEARAIRVWERSGPSERFGLVEAAMRAGRPWHRLVVRHLATLSNPRELSASWLQRSWSGVEADTVRELTGLVARWRQEWPEANGNHRQGTATTMASYGHPDWRNTLLLALQQSEDLPTDVLTPLLQAHEAQAWFALVRRDPLAALDQAAGWPDLDAIASEIASQLLVHGRSRHLPLAVRAQRVGQGRGRDLQPFFLEYGAGDPVVIALARKDELPLDDKARDRLIEIGVRAAIGVRVTDLEPLLQLAPDLARPVALEVLSRLRDQLRPEHAPVVLAAMPAAVAAALADRDDSRGAREQCGQLLRMLVAAEAREGATYARQILSQDSDDDDAQLVATAATTCVQLAGDDASEVVGKLLRDRRPSVVTAALAAPILRSDAELRTQATQAILRLGAELDTSLPIFATLEPDDAIALATTILTDDGLSQFDSKLCISALETLGDRKDGALVPTLARTVHHPDLGVRAVTARQLGRTFSQEAAPFLIEMLKDDSDSIRANAKRSLEEIADYLDARQHWQERLK